MKELTCPNCGKTFQIDENMYADLLSQVRNSEFEAAVAKRVSEMQAQQHAGEVKALEEQVAFYKDFKARKSTKDIGESLEQYCYKLYNQMLRPVMPNATFEKDNDASDGTKGDFIFRDSEDGTEYVSIEFEMKNEADETATKHKNSDFFKKLDEDQLEDFKDPMTLPSRNSPGATPR